MHLVVLIGDEAQVKACFSSFASKAWKSFWTHSIELQGDMGHVESRIGPFEDGFCVGVSCTVCAKLTIGSKIMVDTPDGTPG
jgi:hypothetical protein